VNRALGEVGERVEFTAKSAVAEQEVQEMAMVRGTYRTATGLLLLRREGRPAIGSLKSELNNFLEIYVSQET